MPFKWNPTTQKFDLVRGINPLRAGAVQFDTAHTPLSSAPGLIQWNQADGTYDMGLLNSSVLQVGQEMMFFGKAQGAIANGDVCEFAGVQGDHILIKKAVGSEIETNPHYLVGVATENIANGAFGYVTWFGKVNDIYTKTPANQDSANWLAGDILYFNNVTGQMTKTMPSVPNRIITVAAVIKEQTGASENGKIIVRPTIGTKLQDLDDVNGTPLTTSGQIPVWNNTGKYFDFTSNILTDYVPYREATADVNLGSYSLFANTTGAKFSQFGPDPISTTLTDAVDGLMSIKQSSATSGTIRGLTGVGEFTGALASISSIGGVDGLAYTTAASSGNLTATTSGGGLRNRYIAGHYGAGLLTQASAVSGGITNSTTGGNITDAASFHAESPTVKSGSTWGSHSGLWVRGGSISGTITNRYGLRVDTLTGGTNKYGVYVQSDNSYFGGNVGIGTTNPVSILDIKSPITPILTLSSGSATILAGNIVSSIDTYIPNEGSGITNRIISSIQSIADVNYEGTQAPTSLAFLTQSAGGVAVSEKVRINASGNVGIGTTAPAYSLDVKGLTATSGIRADVGFDINPVATPGAFTGTVSSGGAVDTGLHYYYITYYTAVGETAISIVTGGSVTTTSGNNTVTLTLPVSTDYRVVGRKIYRSKVGSGTEYFLATIANNVGVSYVDTAADSTLTTGAGTAASRENTTSKYLTLRGTPLMLAGSNTTYLGVNSLISQTTGSYNTGFGASVMTHVTTGTNNVGIGYSIMLNGNGSQNVGIGPYALRSGVANTNSYNVGIGVCSLFDLAVNNPGNTAVGNYSGRGAQGSNNIFFGNYAGFQTSNRTVGAQNIAIGYYAGRVLGTGANNILIGNQVELASPTTSDQLNLGNVIYATGLATGSTPSATSKVGIGTSTPDSTLQVVGDARFGEDTASYSEFESDGTLILHGAATTYEDLTSPALALKVKELVLKSMILRTQWIFKPRLITLTTISIPTFRCRIQRRWILVLISISTGSRLRIYCQTSCLNIAGRHNAQRKLLIGLNCQ